MRKIRNTVRILFINIRYFYLTRVYGMDIHKTSRISFKANLDKTNPKGIHIGEDSYVAAGVYLLSHDFSRKMHRDTRIGKACFIGINVIVMPGIEIGDHVIVGSGAVVTRNIPSNCIAAGNPARVIKENIMTKKFGQLVAMP